MKNQYILLVIFMMTIAVAWLGACQKKTGQSEEATIAQPSPVTAGVKV